ncbi:hypothetical protein MOQ72_37165 [Saccharopolyspora sp. K220]|uniref:hypothetical protein n=1 Tax=Saccharopolyspora soli TaxID=2926618 RepID=UPI001F59CBDB|nr:hypothetical protein [Saccharopolyspora soli]MCI2423063.1 hypothetical protein [Saccharopolyspora soli]
MSHPAPAVEPTPTPTPPASDPLPVIGIDPGQTWTACVLRVEDHAEFGWTMGPVGANGQLLKSALSDPDNWVAFGRYVAKLRDALDELVDHAIQRWGVVRIGVEVPHVPVGYRNSSPKFQRLPVRDWLVPRQVAAAVIGAYPEAKKVVADGHGRRPASEYPRELRGARPHHWGPNQFRNGERDHERAAYDVAGVAARMPR